MSKESKTTLPTDASRARPEPNSPEPRLGRLLGQLLGRRVACWILCGVCALFWADVLLRGRVLLPGAMLRGFAPFGGSAGGDSGAPWTILQWDALAQYFPWRAFAGERLGSGHIPLWNPHQFAGAPFVANGQSAVFYPLSLPFWLLDTARAFGAAAFFHSLLAALGAFALLQKWKLPAEASIFGALAWTLGGYLAQWSALPTLAHTASWLPLLLWLFERAAEPCAPASDLAHEIAPPQVLASPARSAPAQLAAASDFAVRSRPQVLAVWRSFRRLCLERSTEVGAGRPSANCAPACTRPGCTTWARTTRLQSSAWVLCTQVHNWPKAFQRRLQSSAPGKACEISATLQVLEARSARLALFALALCCAFLAGHAQIFAFLVLALAWRALTLESPWKALLTLGAGGAWAAALGALQLLPTLELARLGHRAGAQPSEGGWRDIAAHALQPGELFALAAPGWPMATGSLNENFPYVGAVALLLALMGAVLTVRRWRSPQAFALGLAVLGLGTALAWPPARWAYFGVPGAAQLAGVGRALVLWSLGAALLGAFGLEALRQRFPQRAQALALLACAALALELGLSGWAGRVTASREEIYPQTGLTKWLGENTRRGERVLFITPRRGWLPREGFGDSGRTHPPGVLPPNGAMVYGLDDIGGYDSLSPGAYRKYLEEGEPGGVAPQFNGNIVLPGASNARLDELNVRWVITLSGDDSPAGVPGSTNSVVFEADGCQVWMRRDVAGLARGPKKGGRDFSPGWRQGVYQPQSFRLGAFLSLCALAGLVGALAPRFSRRGRGAST